MSIFVRLFQTQESAYFELTIGHVSLDLLYPTVHVTLISTGWQTLISTG